MFNKSVPMKKRMLIPINRAFVSLFVLFFTYQVSYSQCAVPTNVDISVGKCASDFPKVKELSASKTSTSATIEWFSSETDGSALDPDQLLETAIYWVQQTIDDCTSNRVSTSVTIYSPDIPNIDANQTICHTSTQTIADLKPINNNILWYESDYIEGSEDLGTPLPSTTPLINGKTYWAAQYNFPCETILRVSTTIQLKKAPNAGIGTSFTDCEINIVASINLFSLLSNNPDSTGSWTNPNGVSHSGLLVSGNLNGTYTYTVSTNSGICQDVISEVIVTINSPLPPIINETTQSFCESQNATVANLIPNETNIIWYNEEGDILDLNSALVNGIYFASQIEEFGENNCESLNKTEITVSINKLQAPFIENTVQSFCDSQNATISNLIPNSINIIWYDSNGNVLTPETLLENRVYSASQTETINGLTCESVGKSNVTVIINTPSEPTITKTTQYFCKSQNATVSDLTTNNADLTWYDLKGNALTIGTPLENNKIYTTIESSLNCESPNQIEVSVIIYTPEPPIINQTTQVFCESEFATISNLNASNTNLTWYNSEGNLLTLDTILENGIYLVSKTEESENSTCESLNKTEINVIIHSPQPPNNIETSQSFCKIQNATVSDLSPNDETIIWYDSNNNLLAPTTLLTNDSYYCSKLESFELVTCESINKTAVDVSIIEMQNPTATSNQVFCFSNHPTINDLEATGTYVLWFENENDTISLALNPNKELENNKTYWAANINEENGCESPSRVSVIALINDFSSPTTTNIFQIFCLSDKPSLKDLDINESNILWYDSITSDAPLDQELLLEDQKVYYASQINDVTNCESSSRLAINVTLINIESPSISDLGNEFCKVNQPTLSDLNSKVTVSTNEEVKWFSSFPNGLPLSLNERLIEGKTYYAISINSEGCQSSLPLEVTVTLESCDDFDIKLYDGFSPNENGKNDLFIIGNLKELYPNFKVEFYNRWGEKVFTSNASKPSWNGRLNGDGEILPTGVYYYIIYFNKNNKKPIQQRLYLSR